MYIMVENCFHWVGFHLSNFFLEKGISVIGIDCLDTSKKENLSMYLVRNDSFSFYNHKPKDKKTRLTIKLSDHEDEKQSKIILKLFIKTNEQIMEHIIYSPPLIGKWMPSQKMKMIVNDSEELNKAVCIKDYVSAIYQLINRDTLLPDTLNIKSSRKKVKANKILENSVYLRDNRSIHDNIYKILDHYHRFQTFY